MLLSRANATSRLPAGPTHAATDECVPHAESKAIDITAPDVALEDTTVWEVKDAAATTSSARPQKRPPATFALAAGKPHTVTGPRKEKYTEPSVSSV
jgi:hypothetical protein